MKARLAFLVAAFLLGASAAAIADDQIVHPMGQCGLIETMVTVDPADQAQGAIDQNHDGRFCTSTIDTVEHWEDNDVPLWIALPDPPD
jgi:hypothetical protein